MKKITYLNLRALMVSVSLLIGISSSDAQCLAPTLGMFPEYVISPVVCDGQTPQLITEDGYAGEFSMINVIAGQTYTFSSSVPGRYFTISADGVAALTHGTSPLTWVATVTNSIYLIQTLDSSCSEDPDYMSPTILTFICGLVTDEQPDAVTLSPSAATISGAPAMISGQVFEAGLTDVAPNIQGQAPGIQMWVGVSPEGQNTAPSTWTSWQLATYNPAYVGNSDEYTTQLGWNLLPGTYYYATRFRLNNGVYVYGGVDASENGGFWDGTTFVSGVLTVSIPESGLHGLYSLVTTRLDNGNVYTWQNEMIDYFGVNRYNTSTVGHYYTPGGEVGTGSTAPLPSVPDAGYTFQKVGNQIFVPSQNLGSYYTNLVAQTVLQYNASTYNPTTGVLTIEYYITYPNNNLTVNFRSIYTPLFLSNNEYTASTLKYFPNPVKDVLNLTLNYKNSVLTLTTMTGQQVMMENLLGDQTQIDLSHLSQGIYIAQLTSDNQTHTFKIIKE